MKIISYPLKKTTKEFIINMHKGTEILSVQVILGTPHIITKADTELNTEKRIFQRIKIGESVPPHDKFIGTYQLKDGNLVFLLFEK